MKSENSRTVQPLGAGFILFVASVLNSSAVTFTTDTLIRFDNTNYDGQDIVVTNCTLTIDGHHSFASIRLLMRGVLTHSFAESGLLTNSLNIGPDPFVLSATNAAALLMGAVPSTVVVTDLTGSTQFVAGSDYAITSQSPYSLILVPGSRIPEGASVLVNYVVERPPVPTGLDLQIENDMEITPGGTINVYGRGYAGLSGPGAARSRMTTQPVPLTAGGGGGFGGYGGASSNGGAGGNAYGSVTAPDDKGSGGSFGLGSGGPGGGAVNLAVNGELRVDGLMTASGASGTNSASGGGSGGGIWIKAGQFVGNGYILADGGSGEPQNGGGGGGGRISVATATNEFTGTFSAHGGSGATPGGAGTLFIQAKTRRLVIENAGAPGTNTPVTSLYGADVMVQGGAILGLQGQSLSLKSLTVRSNSLVTISGESRNVTLSATEDLTVESGGSIDLNGRGGSNSGPRGSGAGTGVLYSSTPAPLYAGGGGGHGGSGGGIGAGGGMAYGSINDFLIGSAGGPGGLLTPRPEAAGRGGGAMRLVVGGTILIEGELTVDGTPATLAGCGGGSGGSIIISAGRLAGAGRISANGGSGGMPIGGGGAGGRVAIQAQTNDFTGAITAFGGSGAMYGGAGTVWWLASKSNSAGQVLVDNAGHLGTNTLVAAPFIAIFAVDLTIRNGGQVAFIPGNVRNLELGSNAWITASSRTFQSLRIGGNALIAEGGGIRADSMGAVAQSGPGAGRGGGGGSYGGVGGAGASFGTGGNPYGSPLQPSDLGSGGSGELRTQAGAGGGAINLSITGKLTLDGTISADGGPGFSGTGAGSGGSVWITAGTIAGAGSISADGGDGGLPSGGGGGGGRIAVYSGTNDFAGKVHARGGFGANNGGAGTVFYRHLFGISGNIGELVVDNGGLMTAANTPLTSIEGADLSIKGGSSVSTADIHSVRNLYIGSGSRITAFATPRTVTITLNGSATIESGGGIILDGMGFPARSGQGGGRALGAGGGYGGYGGAGLTNAPGGLAYGFADSPNEMGSGGGGLSSSSGGSGGGALKMIVRGELMLKGKITADGAAGPAAGGGSGGSVWIDAGKISGDGLISARGGNGDEATAGGGGGGRISVACGTNAFAGEMLARGGAGVHDGGAGTVYVALKTNQTLRALMLVDNGGSVATNTLIRFGAFLAKATAPDVIIRGGALATFNPPTPYLNRVTVESNAWIAIPNVSSQIVPLVLDVQSATIQAGGGILVDGRGFGASMGKGAGGTFSEQGVSSGGGGGYGGDGGASASGARGGAGYETEWVLSQPGGGSGGGGAYKTGGAGGGGLRLQTEDLVVNGKISANGLAGTFGGGGGSGGALWIRTGRLSGTGLIQANGGAGDLLAGGGGGSGGRVLIDSETNFFAGSITAYGGRGATHGGAGTVGIRIAESAPYLTLDNGGEVGERTTFYSTVPFDLSVSGGAIARPAPQTTALGLGSLIVESGGVLEGNSLDITVGSHAIIGTNASISADYRGYSGTNAGPGTGTMLSGGSGSGGAHGGNGGASASGELGGRSYGIPEAPAESGSRGGLYPVLDGYSQGGGVIRLRVMGPLTLAGRITANGNDADLENAGGGAGGSIWITAQRLEGSGTVAANGGRGDLLAGGGGGGGRIAIYSGHNEFHGTWSVLGAEGAFFGEDGTVVTGLPPAPFVMEQTPADTISYAVTNIDLTFSGPMNFETAEASDVRVGTPLGPLPSNAIQIFGIWPATLRITIPPQTVPGQYQVRLGTQMEDVFGAHMSQPWAGTFVIIAPMIKGHVTDGGGQSLANVSVKPSGGNPVFTDANGNYSIEVQLGWSGIVRAIKDNLWFFPAERIYENLSASLADQNFVVVTPGPLAASKVAQGGAISLAWSGQAGVQFTLMCSTNLISWMPYGQPTVGTNVTLNIPIPKTDEGRMFFRVQTSP